MIQKPLVSVVTPCFNTARFIVKAIESVREQDYPFVEHIVMDGASSDSTLQILEQYPHLIWTSEPDRGQSDALNKGFQLASGDIIGWLNADDIYQPQAISRAVEFLQNNPDMDFVYGDCIELDENDAFTRMIKGRLVKNYRDFIFKQPIPQPTVFFRKNVLKKLKGVNENLHYVMDWEFWLRASLDFRFGYLSGQPLAGFRKYTGSKSHTWPRRFNDEWILVLKQLRENSSDQANILIEKGIRYQKALLHIADALNLARQKERRNAIGKLFSAIREFPSTHLIKAYIYLLLSILTGENRQPLTTAKKTIHILYVQSGKGMGGAKISLSHLINSLDHEKIKAHLAMSSPIDHIFSEKVDSQVASIKTVYLPFWYKNSSRHFRDRLMSFFSKVWHGWYLFPVLQLTFFILKNKIDLVHSNNSASPVGAIAAWWTLRPHIWHIRESIGTGTDFPLVLGDRISARLMKMLSRQIICISAYTSHFFIRNGIKTTVILNGINVNEFDEANERGNALRKKIGLDSNIVVGMVGNLRANLKEHDLFLKAIASVFEKKPTIRFVIFGSTSDLGITEYTRSLQQLADSLNLGACLVWADHVDDIPAMMHSFDILVHPTSKEGSGRVIMEAMAAGNPVVAMQAGGVQELIQHGKTGFLVEPQNTTVMAEAVITLLDNQDLMQKMGEQAKLYARQHFSHEKTALQIFQVYQQVLTKFAG